MFRFKHFSRALVSAASCCLLVAGPAATALAASPKVAVGSDFIVVSHSDGSVWAWGLGNDGQLGNGLRTSSSRPVRVSGLNGVVDVFAGDFFAAALKADGTVWVWGSGGNGVLGSNLADFTTRAPTPQHIPELSGIWTLALGRNGDSAFAADTQGRVYQWGNNSMGQAGTGAVSGNAVWRKVPALVPGLAEVFALAAADGTFVAASWQGAVWGWGANELGALGATARSQRGGLPLAVQPIPGATDVVALASLTINDDAQFAVQRDGLVLGWGTNTASHASCGQLPSGVPTLSAPRPVNGLNQIFAAAGGTAHALFLAESGTVQGCGANATGQLGDNSTLGTQNGKAGPLRVSLPVAAVAVGAGRNSSAAVAVDGSVWVWGQLSGGAAGNGGPSANNTTLQFLSPQAVVGELGTGRFNAGALASAPALYTGTQTGPLGRVNIDVGFSPLTEDIGREARIYLAAQLPDGTLYLFSDATGWQLYGGGAVTPYLNGVLSRHVALPLYRAADLSGTAGIRLLVGYGLGSNDEEAQASLLNRGTHGEALLLR